MPMPACMQSWSAYCRWRGLPNDHAAPLLLSAPLTVWHATQHLLPHLYASLDRPPQELSITSYLHLIVAGACVEFALVATFCELFRLCQTLQELCITFVGPEMPKKLDGNAFADTTVNEHALADAEVTRQRCIQML